LTTCPKYRGNWLGNGKLDKLNERPGSFDDRRERNVGAMMTVKAASADFSADSLIDNGCVCGCGEKAKAVS
jgi:Zn-finger nucleic acid-binding protein